MEQAEREADARNAEGAGAMDVEEEEDNPETAIVLAEDKKYYPSAEEVYGEGTETLVMDEDAQPLEEPIIAPLKTKRVEVRDANAPVMRVSEEYLLGMLSNPNLTRNVAVCGHLHHGKASFMDMVVEQTHALSTEGRDPERQMRYMDNRQDEQDREVSIKATPLTVARPASSEAPAVQLHGHAGHVSTSDEVTPSLRLAGAVLLVVDAVEGVMCVTERVIKHAARDRLPIVVFVNKMDRLILELKLPPADAFHKIRHVLEEVNAVIEAAYGGGEDCPFADPAKGTVCFGSALYGWSFTLESFARLYAERRGWRWTRRSSPNGCGGTRTSTPTRALFAPSPRRRRPLVRAVRPRAPVQGVRAGGEHAASFAAVLAEFKVTLKPKEYKMNVKPLVRLACRKILATPPGWWTRSRRTARPPGGRAREGGGGARRARFGTKRADAPRAVASMRACAPPAAAPRDGGQAVPEATARFRRAGARDVRDGARRADGARFGRGVLPRRRGGLRGGHRGRCGCTRPGTGYPSRDARRGAGFCWRAWTRASSKTATIVEEFSAPGTAKRRTRSAAAVR